MSDSSSAILAFRGPHRYLSNFYVEEDGFTVEHRFQAAKTTSQAERLWVLNSRTPAQAKNRGNRVSLRDDWEDVKESVMLELLREKFHPGSKLAQWLLSTDDAELSEGNTWGDTYWGVDLRTGKGRNRLGVLLMQVREELFADEVHRQELHEQMKAEMAEEDW